MTDQNLQFYGFERALEEKWDLACTRLSSPEKWNQLLSRGAVVVAMFDYGLGEEDYSLKEQRMAMKHPERATMPNGNPRPPFPSGRSWWIGLPPAYIKADLESLAEKAGMLGPRPLTFRWQRPRSS